MHRRVTTLPIFQFRFPTLSASRFEGALARVFGSSAFSGAINIVTRADAESNVTVAAEGGSFGTFGGDASVNLATGAVRQKLSGGYTQSDGGTENSDFRRRRAYYTGSWKSRYVDMQWQGGFVAGLRCVYVLQCEVQESV